MTTPEALYQSALPSLKLRARGKVRDIYDIDDKYMLIVATDRLSAFDVILPDPIPGKGLVLTRISNFWFNKLDYIMPNHLTNISLSDVLPDANDNPVLDTVAMAEPPDCSSKFPEVSPDVMMPPGPLVEALIEAIYFS